MEILVARDLNSAEVGFGLQQALLEKVSEGGQAAALLWTSAARYVAATRPETRLPGFDRAVQQAEAAGFPVLIRNSGGGAVAANRGCISFSLTFPVEEMRHGLYERYAGAVDLVVEALGNLGVAAEAGEVEGEFCPGAYSVRTNGFHGHKVAGLAQRVTRRAARVEALVLVAQTTEVREVLAEFYGTLELPFRPGSVADLLPGASVSEAIETLVEAVRGRYDMAGPEGEPGEGLLRRAEELREGWRAGPGLTGPVSSDL